MSGADDAQGGTIGNSHEAQLPPRFREFLKENKVDERVYSLGSIPRFVRFVGSFNDIERVERELGIKIEPVGWIPRFYRLPADCKIVDNPSYKRGDIFGMDVSSAAAVYALGLKDGDDVLDLCCAPGAKLLLISELVRNTGSVTGINFSKERALTCKSLLKKFRRGNIRLFQSDGTTFSAGPPEKYDIETENPLYGHVKNSKRRKAIIAQENSLLYKGLLLKESDNSSLKPLYDKVIVDAECTHDGSIKHVQKFDFWGWETFERKFFNPERINELESLQRRLLLNGYNMCKPGGCVIYSTCSFARKQNEDVVSWLLEKMPQATVIPIEKASIYPHQSGFIPHTLRFDPISSNTSGLFVAKIQKPE